VVPLSGLGNVVNVQAKRAKKSASLLKRKRKKKSTGLFIMDVVVVGECLFPFILTRYRGAPWRTIPWISLG
jgi:hypothetical protein